MDVNAYALQAADPSHALGAIIRKAEWLGKGRPFAAATVPVVVVPPSAAASVKWSRRRQTKDEDLDDDELDELDDDKLEELEEEVDAVDKDDEPAGRRSDCQPASDAARPPILTASPLPPAPQEIDAEVSGDEVAIQLGHRRYRVRGLSKNLSFDQLKVNVLASTDNGMFVDTFDLYVARHRRQFIAQAA